MATELSMFRDENLEYDRLADLEAEQNINRVSLDEELVNVECSSTFAIVGIVIGIGCTTIALIIMLHHKSSAMVLQFIAQIFTTLAFAYCLLWSRRAIYLLKLARQPVALQTTIAFQMSFFLALYHGLHMIWLIIYRPIHYYWLLSMRANQDTWRESFGNDTFGDLWKKDKSILAVLVIASPVMSFSFGYICYSARSLHTQKYYLSRMVLYTSLVIVSIAAWMTIYWAQTVFIYQSIMPDDTIGNQTAVLKFIAIVTLFLAIANVFANLNRRKSFYMILTLVSLVAAMAAFASTGIILRESRISTFRETFSNSDCRTTMVSIHENNLENFCPVGGKYLNADQTCKKADLVYRWEGDNVSDIRALNPACCQVAKLFYVEPFIYLAYWGLMMVFTLITICIFNLVLSDYDGSRLWVGRVTKVLDLASIAAIASIFIVFLLYFVLRDPVQISNGTNPQVDSYISPLTKPIRGLQLVPNDIKAVHDGTADHTQCNDWHENVFPMAMFTSQTGCQIDCSYRVALLVERGTLKIESSENAQIRTNESRSAFFPGCTDPNDYYVLLYGSLEGIQKAINESSICSKDPKGPLIALKYSQVAKNSIDGDGLTMDEKHTTSLASQSGPNSASCRDGFTESTKCVDECQVMFNPAKVTLPEVIKGRLYFQKVDSDVKYNEIPSTINIEAHRGTEKVGTNFDLFEGGLWMIENVPRIYDYSYVMTLKITDSSGQFLSKQVDVLVPGEDGTDTELSAGSIRLLTASGQVCTGDPAEECPANLETRNGSLHFIVKDETGSVSIDDPFGDIQRSVEVLKGHGISGEVVRQVRDFDFMGKAIVNNLEYGSYTIYSKKKDFFPTVRYVDLQEVQLYIDPIILRPTKGFHDLSITATMLDLQSDFDLQLMILSDTGFTCTVSPYNKYCGYAMVQNDISLGQVGDETIHVKRLAIATYLSFVSPAEPYDLKCQLGTDIDTSNQHYESWNWSEYKKTTPLSAIGIDLSTIFNGDESDFDADGKETTGLIPLKPVENTNQAESQKMLISRNGVELESGQKWSFKTNFGGKILDTEDLLFPDKQVETSQSISEANEEDSDPNTWYGFITASQSVEVTQTPALTENTELSETSLSQIVEGLSGISNITFPFKYPDSVSLDLMAKTPMTYRQFENDVLEETDSYKLNRTEDYGDMHCKIDVIREKENNEDGSLSVFDMATNRSTLPDDVVIETEYNITVDLQPDGTPLGREFALKGRTMNGSVLFATRETNNSKDWSPEGGNVTTVKDSSVINLADGRRLTGVNISQRAFMADNGQSADHTICSTEFNSTGEYKICNTWDMSSSVEGSRLILNKATKLEKLLLNSTERLLTFEENRNKYSNTTRQNEVTVTILTKISDIITNTSSVNTFKIHSPDSEEPSYERRTRNVYSLNTENSLTQESNITMTEISHTDGKSNIMDSQIKSKGLDGSELAETLFSNEEITNSHREDVQHRQNRKLWDQNSPILFTLNETFQNSTQTTATNGISSMRTVATQTKVLKNGKNRTSVNETIAVDPVNDESQADRYTYNSIFLQTSLDDDSDKAKESTELIEKNQNAKTVYSGIGPIISKTMVHKEISNTDARLNTTLEDHSVTKLFKNGSKVIRARLVIGKQHLDNGTIYTKRNYSQTVYDDRDEIIDVSWTFSETQSDGMTDREILFETYPIVEDPPRHQASHRQSRPKAMHFEGIEPGNADANFILGSCFTGYGKSSFILLNKVVVSKPSVESCDVLINRRRPQFTVAELRKEVDEYLMRPKK